MPNAKNVSTGKPKITGAIFAAPVGTTLPTSALSELDSAFKELGYTSDDGFTMNMTKESTDIKAWGNDIVLSPQTEYSDGMSMKLIEVLNINTLEVVYGEDNVSGNLDTGLTVRANSKEADNYSWVVDIIMNNDTLKRIVVPIAKLKEMSEITYKDDEAVGFDCTFQAYPYANYDGDTHREFMQKTSGSGTVSE